MPEYTDIAIPFFVLNAHTEVITRVMITIIIWINDDTEMPICIAFLVSGVHTKT